MTFPLVLKPNVLKAIGQEFGTFKNHDDKEGGIRVEINALKPLIMRKSFTFPTGEEASLEFEYEHMEKHCFLCISLLHEEKDCSKDKGSTVRDSKSLGITQQKTLERLEYEKIRYDSRRDILRTDRLRSVSPRRHMPLKRYPLPPRRSPSNYHQRKIGMSSGTLPPAGI